MNKVSDISTSRCLNAPIEVVWKAWTDPAQVAQWWGPRGFRNTIETHDFKPGGLWKFIMHGPDGTDYPNEIIFVEIITQTRIVMDHIVHPKFRMSVDFKADGDRTWIYFDSYFENPAVADSVKDFAIVGNAQLFERLETQLGAYTGRVLAKPFVMSRTFNTSVDRMWAMWTDPQHMCEWWGPKEVSVGYSKMDFKRGGDYHYSMVTSDGGESWGKMIFIDIVPHHRLMFVNGFSNPNGDLVAPPMAPNWPKEILSTINFEANGNTTTVTIEWLPINATSEEIHCFNGGHEGMTQGWTGSLDRLAGVLAG